MISRPIQNEDINGVTINGYDLFRNLAGFAPNHIGLIVSLY